MARIEILEQRAGFGEDGNGQQANKEDMDGCGGTQEIGPRKTQWLCQGFDEARRVSICQYRQRNIGG